MGHTKPNLDTTPEENERLAAAVVLNLSEVPAVVARFLLLCHVLTYTQKQSDREHILGALEKECAPFMPSFDDAVRQDLADALAGVREGSK